MKVVNIHNIPSIEQRISIHISGNSVPENKNPNSIDDEAAKQFEELTQVFTIFALMDQLSNQLFNSMNENRGFLSLEEILQEESKSNEKKNDFKEAHVEFIEGKSSLNKGERDHANHDEINDVADEDFEEKKIIIKRNNEENNSGDMTTKKEIKAEKEPIKKEEDQENSKDEEVIISRKTKEENKKTSNKSILSVVLAIIIAGILFCFFKCRMDKDEVKESFRVLSNNNNKVHEENIKMNANKGD